MFSSPSELTLGEAYIFGDFDIEGDIEAAFDLSDYLLVQERSLWEKFDLKERLAKLPKSERPQSGLHLADFGGKVHSKQRDRKAIHYHYDLPAEFYELWLDPRMVYSCAYFSKPDEDLDRAQLRKLDYICRKLRLSPGERLLDIGCGWGALIRHAAAHYGAECVGITLSVPQAEVGRECLRAAGLNDHCRVEVSDYRDIDQDRQYDKIVSVGMFEHVGEALLPEYFHRAWNLLRPDGVFLNHGISHSATYHRRGPSFTDRYVFPDGDLVPISTSLRAAELSGFEVRDVESLREHYALTLHHWLKRLESHAEEARQITSDTTYRIWRLYMAGSAHGFRSGRLNVYQTLLAKPANGRGGLPLTRDDWYQTRAWVDVSLLVRELAGWRQRVSANRSLVPCTATTLRNSLPSAFALATISPRPERRPTFKRRLNSSFRRCLLPWLFLSSGAVTAECFSSSPAAAPGAQCGRD